MPKTKAKSRTHKRSIRVQPATTQQFLDFRITEQTLYWVLFGAVAIFFTLWIFSVDARLQNLYDEIDARTYSLTQMPVTFDNQ